MRSIPLQTNDQIFSAAFNNAHLHQSNCDYEPLRWGFSQWDKNAATFLRSKNNKETSKGSSKKRRKYEKQKYTKPPSHAPSASPSSAPNAIPPITWKLGFVGQSCEEVCDNLDLTCNQAVMQDTCKSSAFSDDPNCPVQVTGYTCKTVTEADIFGLGVIAPYVDADISDGANCFFSSTPGTSECSAHDVNSERFCFCDKGAGRWSTQGS